ncbi:hypothetical protein [Amaricoccus macauensis]|uniref:hypothetical protein n=1 Tax=Amaricoccus macauensis TaxID=57001 RepID=UPI003C7BF96B
MTAIMVLALAGHAGLLEGVSSSETGEAKDIMGVADMAIDGDTFRLRGLDTRITDPLLLPLSFKRLSQATVRE